MMTPSRRSTCTDHCAGCGGHFHGMGAFDAHLKRVDEEPNRWGVRGYHFEHLSAEAAGLEVWTSTGECNLTSPFAAGVPILRKPLTDWVKAWKARDRVEKARSGKPSSRGAPESPAKGAEPLPAHSAPVGQLDLLAGIAGEGA